MSKFRTLAALLVAAVLATHAHAQENCSRHLPLGELPGANQVFCYQGYAVGYSHGLKIPLWAAYRLSNESANGANVDRQDDFRMNSEVPLEHSSTTADYRGSGYDRGHMAPSGSIDFSAAANSETFFLSNMVPQRPGFNRDGFGHEGVWGFLENEVRDWVRERDEIYVISGAIASGQNTIGEGVSVPEAFYKIVIDLQEAESIAFLMPHEDDLRDRASEFIVSIDRIEEITGLDLFSRIVDEQESRLESYIAPRMW